MFILADITGGLESILSILLNFVTYCFTWLDNITFMGTSLLRFTITISILGVVLDIMFTLVKNRSIKESRPGAKHEKGAKKE